MYKLEGVVIKGKDRGKKLGFPTANIEPTESIPEGIYVSLTEIENETFKSVTFIGSARTFGEIEVFAETHILDFDQDLYGKKIKIKLIMKIRDNQKFENIADLITQIEKDVKIAKKYFKDKK